MAVDERTDVRRTIEDIQDRLRPDQARAWAVARLDELFRSGSAPDPAPEGFLSGRLVMTSTWEWLDLFGRRFADLYMPWLGKSFEPSTATGVNVLLPSARTPMRVIWRNYVPERELADRIEAFPFRTRIAPGEVDPDVDVLKIDYDFEANPSFMIRRILDELVQVDSGFYLGKVLFRRQGSWVPIGYFTLESQ